MKFNVDYTLYLVTDRTLMGTDTLEEAVEQAIAGGCTMIQLREKEASSLSFYETALRLKAITDKYHVPFLINDRADIALAVDADGVHVGQSDLPAQVVRRMIGSGKLLGVSVSTVDEAVKAVEDGADYIGVGAMYSTGTKTDAVIVSMDELNCVRKAVSIPIVVIGGINQDTAPDFMGTGIDGLAVVSAVIAQKDIAGAARGLIRIFRGGANA
jgi:thiamine-phosphate pyrophosphorylase